MSKFVHQRIHEDDHYRENPSNQSVRGGDCRASKKMFRGLLPPYCSYVHFVVSCQQSILNSTEKHDESEYHHRLTAPLQYCQCHLFGPSSLPPPECPGGRGHPPVSTRPGPLRRAAPPPARQQRPTPGTRSSW